MNIKPEDWEWFLGHLRRFKFRRGGSEDYIYQEFKRRGYIVEEPEEEPRD